MHNYSLSKHTCLNQAHHIEAKQNSLYRVIPDSKAHSMEFVLKADDELTVYNV